MVQARSVRQSRSADGGATFTVINAHLKEETDVVIAGVPRVGTATGHILTANDPATGNDAAAPDRVVPVSLTVYPDGRESWRVTLPPHSVATVRIETR